MIQLWGNHSESESSPLELSSPFREVPNCLPNIHMRFSLTSPQCIWHVSHFKLLSKAELVARWLNLHLHYQIQQLLIHQKVHLLSLCLLCSHLLSCNAWSPPEDVFGQAAWVRRMSEPLRGHTNASATPSKHLFKSTNSNCSLSKSFKGTVFPASPVKFLQHSLLKQ